MSVRPGVLFSTLRNERDDRKGHLRNPNGNMVSPTGSPPQRKRIEG